MAMLRRWMAFPRIRFGFGSFVRPGSGSSAGGSGSLDFSSAANSANLMIIGIL